MKVLIEASEAYWNRGGIRRFSREFLRHLPHGFETAYRSARFCDSHYVPEHRTFGKRLTHLAAQLWHTQIAGLQAANAACSDVYYSLSFFASLALLLRAFQPIRDSVMLLTGQPHSNEDQQIQQPVWQRHPEARFVCIGPRTDYSRRAFLSFCDRRVIELDIIDLQTKTDAIAACSLLCVPFGRESFA
jgi:hypothetical protein